MVNSLIVTFVILLVLPGAALAAPVAVPRTGQATSYAAGDDGDLKPGAPWPEARFSDNGDATMTDQATGLIWDRNGGAKPRTDTCTGGTKRWADAMAYVQCLNTSTYLGHDDWRLPNLNELESLVNAGVKDSAAWLNGQGFQNVPSNKIYWSSTTVQGVDSSAWLLHMTNGYVSYFNKSNTIDDYYVWPVRAGQTTYPHRTGQTVSYAAGDDGALKRGVPWPAVRLISGSSGTVSDSLTGLTWVSDANLMKSRHPGFDADGTKGDGLVSWQRALDYVAQLNREKYAGYGDWRLPSRRELMSLIDRSQSGFDSKALPAGHPFSNVGSSYWSSTTTLTDTSTNYAWKLDFVKGVMDSNLKTCANYLNCVNYVWPVRTSDAVLTGVVRDAATAAPLSGAAVTVDLVAVQTDPSGSYSATVTAGPHTVTTGASGYETQSVQVTTPAGETSTLNIDLKPLVPVTVEFTGTGRGTVSDLAAGFSCGTPCTQLYVWNSTLKLAATASPYALFIGWNGGCTGSDCSFTVTSPVTVSAGFDIDAAHSVREDGPPERFFPSLQEALDTVDDGATLRTWAIDFPGLTLARPVALHLFGGYSADYALQTGTSVIAGPLTIAAGRLTVDGIAVR